MSDSFFRFPHTPHIAWLGEGAPRDDKVLATAEVADLLDGEVVVEEKLDGANLGFSLAPDGALRAQNRGQYLGAPHAGQFRRLPEWLAAHGAGLAEALGEHLIAFGEWCAARHSLAYTALPDWWLLFDVYDRRERRFWSTNRRNTLATKLGLTVVPCIARGRQTVATLRTIVTTGHSRFRKGGFEGVVVRREDDDWLLARGKLVQTQFVQSMGEHWRKRSIEWNRVAGSGPMVQIEPAGTKRRAGGKR